MGGLRGKKPGKWPSNLSGYPYLGNKELLLGIEAYFSNMALEINIFIF